MDQLPAQFAPDDLDHPEGWDAPGAPDPKSVTGKLYYFMRQHSPQWMNDINDGGMRVRDKLLNPPAAPPLTPEQQASPYRAAPRALDGLPYFNKFLNAYAGDGAPVSTNDLTNMALGVGSLALQPLRGVGDIVNAIRGTNYPRADHPAAENPGLTTYGRDPNGSPFI